MLTSARELKPSFLTFSPSFFTNRSHSTIFNMSDLHPQFSPACPIPYILYPAERVEEPKEFLQTDFGKVQRVNVEALIRLYENCVIEPRQRGDPRSTLLKDNELKVIHGMISRYPAGEGDEMA